MPGEKVSSPFLSLNLTLNPSIFLVIINSSGIIEIIKNFDLRNSSNRKNKIKFEDIIREIFADGLIEKDFENRKIEKTIKSMESIIP